MSNPSRSGFGTDLLHGMTSLTNRQRRIMSPMLNMRLHQTPMTSRLRPQLIHHKSTSLVQGLSQHTTNRSRSRCLSLTNSSRIPTGVHLVPPHAAPRVFQTTRASDLFDTVVDDLLQQGILHPDTGICYAFDSFSSLKHLGRLAQWWICRHVHPFIHPHQLGYTPPPKYWPRFRCEPS
jgi:hypothetical protein